MARELGPQGIHVVHLVLDAMVDTKWVRERITATSGADALDKLRPDELMDPEAVGDAYWQLHGQPRSAWTHELDIRPYIERW